MSCISLHSYSFSCQIFLNLSTASPRKGQNVGVFLLFKNMAVLLASMKVPVLEHLLDFTGSSIPASSRTLAKLMMNFRSLGLLAILILLIVPVECFSGRSAFYNYVRRDYHLIY